jgi:hypothetical protein
MSNVLTIDISNNDVTINVGSTEETMDNDDIHLRFYAGNTLYFVCDNGMITVPESMHDNEVIKNMFNFMNNKQTHVYSHFSISELSQFFDFIEGRSSTWNNPGTILELLDYFGMIKGREHQVIYLIINDMYFPNAIQNSIIERVVSGMDLNKLSKQTLRALALRSDTVLDIFDSSKDLIPIAKKLIKNVSHMFYNIDPYRRLNKADNFGVMLITEISSRGSITSDETASLYIKYLKYKDIKSLDKLLGEVNVNILKITIRKLRAEYYK